MIMIKSSSRLFLSVSVSRMSKQTVAAVVRVRVVVDCTVLNSLYIFVVICVISLRLALCECELQLQVELTD